MIKEAWQADIVVRDLLAARTLMSHIANKLYPELPDAADRERRLVEVPEMARLAAICQQDITALSAELAVWESKAA